MIDKKVVFQCQSDLQMKAVAILVQRASEFRSTVYLVRNGRRANAKSLLGVMSLGIENGAEIEICADGDDAAEAADTLAAYLDDPKS